MIHHTVIICEENESESLHAAINITNKNLSQYTVLIPTNIKSTCAISEPQKNKLFTYFVFEDFMSKIISVKDASLFYRFSEYILNYHLIKARNLSMDFLDSFSVSYFLDSHYFIHDSVKLFIQCFIRYKFGCEMNECSMLQFLFSIDDIYSIKSKFVKQNNELEFTKLKSVLKGKENVVNIVDLPVASIINIKSDDQHLGGPLIVSTSQLSPLLHSQSQKNQFEVVCHKVVFCNNWPLHGHVNYSVDLLPNTISNNIQNMNTGHF